MDRPSKNTTEEIGTWLRTFVEEFRKAHLSLSEVEKKGVSNLDNMLPPCQVHAICFNKPDIQLVVISHAANQPDAKITVDGPYEARRSIDVFEGILNDKSWEPEIDRKQLEGLFMNTFSQMNIFGGERPAATMKMMLGDRFVWIVKGELTSVAPNEFVGPIIEGAKRSASIRPQPAAPPPPTLHAWGTYFFPALWVGSPLEPTFRERLTRSFLGRFYEKAFDMEYKGQRLVVNREGYIAIAAANIGKARDALNEIMSTATLMGLPCLAVRESELAEAVIDASTLSLSSWGLTQTSIRGTLLEARWSLLPVGRRNITESELQAMIKNAEKVTADFQTRDNFLLFLEAHTHFSNSEFVQSFLMSWIIIERHLYDQWSEYLAQNAIKGERRRKLENPGLWSVDFIIETLTIGQVVSATDYKKLMDIKSLRNDVIHEGETVTKEESAEALSLARVIVESVM